MSALDVCCVCNDLVPLNDDGTTTTYLETVTSSFRGCESCALILHALNECVPEALVSEDGPPDIQIVIRQAIMRSFIELAIKWGDHRGVILDLFVEANTTCPWSTVRVGVPTSGNTISHESFDLVRTWFDDCLKNHKHCRFSKLVQAPPRLLDLYAVQPNVVLCEPSHLVKYICLSHCWGDSRAVTTTLDNVSSFKSAIVFSNLPRTFQEAVIFTRKMGVRYLWIDSLCIIQDSEEDWQAQSALMSSIYANSCLTLAATGSSSDDGGLFFRHPKATFHGISKVGSEYKVHARPVIDHMDDAQFPLFKRAWVFQERLLAPRVLHFGRQEMWWECMETVDCECGGIVSNERYGSGQEKFFSKITHQEAFLREGDVHLRRRWHAIIEEYTQLSLTKMRDRLPALSGIAEQMANPPNGPKRDARYIAGLWNDTLLQDLLWYRLDALCSAPTPKWRAPSWSWAGQEGSVRYFDAPHIQESTDSGTRIDHENVPFLHKIHVEILEAEARVANQDNPYGEVLSAHLRLKGPLVTVSVSDSRSLSSRTLHQKRRLLRRQALRSVHYEFRFETTDNPNSYPFFADYDLQKHDQGFADATFAILRVATCTNFDEYAMLLKCIHKDQNIWERVGLFTTKFAGRSTADHNVYQTTFATESLMTEITVV
ncbi:uncharacterized protein PV09_06065 [Verruconis gallopava]|uniref:Heterokaryon incompatibility domain-containing protein n=1 Tax=Verruconis gallopava TaxID=253628 RepID=A0A0D2A7T1_9PEZI|nr:uncharacterized protein PV09_06065 [Verruconis gallopava]KIW02620.1 hypothetical protein PV09_06065 [Verruconis gallopava]